MILCDYGCGQEAKYFFKNGKKCCSKNHGSCPNRKLSIYDRNKCNGFQKTNCKYCNKQISNEQKKKHENSCKLNPKNIRYCLKCGKILTSRESKKFCSRSCSASYNTKGRKHSKETKQKISDSGCGGYRECPSRYKTGVYKGIFCASSYELIFVAYHLYNNSNIKPCRIKIPYSYKGKNHCYHPDFIIDGKIYEIKGYHTKVVDIKTSAAKEHGFDIDVLYYEELEPMLNILKETLKINDILELYE